MRKDLFYLGHEYLLLFVKEVKHFASLNLITREDVVQLKEELHQLLAVIEHLSIKGEFSENKKVSFYLSNISFEATYSYIEKKNYRQPAAGIFY